MADRVLFQTDDALSEQNLAEQRARENSTDYVERGLTVTPDWTNNEIDVASGHAVVLDGVHAYDVFPDARTGLALAAGSGLNYVWLVVDTSAQDDVSVVINADGSAPAGASLLIAEVDAGSESVLMEQPKPDATFGEANAGTFSTGKLDNVADKIVGSASELESAFNNLSAGDTIYVGQPATSMETTQWLDINVSDVTVEFESPFAEDGMPAVTAADGANVGGIRIGNSTSVNNVTIRRFGFDGNHSNQDQTVTRLHGVKAQQVSNLKVDGCFVTRTSPYHEHGTGGSGISTTDSCENVWITNNWVDDPGDRCIQMGAHNYVVANNRCSNGFDRGISSQMQPDISGDGTSRWGIIHGNIISNLSDGSAIGIHGSATDSYIITNNIAHGDMRGLIKIFPAADTVVVSGNIGDATGATTTTNGITTQQTEGGSGEIHRLTITDNVLRDYDIAGINLNAPTNYFNVSDNQIIDAAKSGITGTDNPSQYGVIRGNVISGANRSQAMSNAGIRGDFADTTFAFNFVADTYSLGVRPNGGSNNIWIGNVLVNNALDSNTNLSWDAGMTTNELFAFNIIDGSNTSNAAFWTDSATHEFWWNTVRNGSINAPNGSRFNGEVKQSANAETPTATGTVGFINFTDSGDGSGDGVFYEDRDGNTHGPI